MTRSVAWELIRSGRLVRSVRVTPFVTSLVAGAVFLVARGDMQDVMGNLRVLGLLLALGSGYVLDDGAAVTLQASPYSLARRLWLRIGCGAVFVVPLWMVLLVAFLPSAPSGDRWTIGLGLTIELVAVLTVIWAVAAWGRRFGIENPGIITTPALVASLLMTASIPSAPMLVGLGTQWTHAHVRWLWVLVGAFGVLMVGMRDPAGRRRNLGATRGSAEQAG